jgi:uncharacterized short protein YbdD (DUF466 family)
MGCDIHLYIEHKERGSDYWECFGKKINPGRHYGIFAKMAGVGNYDNIIPVSTPRGLPEKTSFVVNDDNSLFIEDESAEAPGYCTKEQADRWVASGSSKYVSEWQVTHPDWHSHSWLTPDEYEKAIKGVEFVDVEWKVILTVLREFQKYSKDARVVFWFDN